MNYKLLKLLTLYNQVKLNHQKPLKIASFLYSQWIFIYYVYYDRYIPWAYSAVNIISSSGE